jgi:hypothetical protein
MQNFDYRSPYISYANKEINWLNPDSESSYEKNLKVKFKELEINGWIDEKISYKFNSEGFRSDEFDRYPSLIALGCSFTFGIGVRYEQTWPFLLSSKLNLKCWNLGVPGGSNDTAFRLGLHYIPKLNPKYVVLLSPYSERLEILEDTEKNSFFTTNLLPNWCDEKSYESFYKRWILNESNSILNRHKNILALKEICNSLNINFLYKEAEFPTKNFIDLARDLGHWGPKTNELLASEFYSEIE